MFHRVEVNIIDMAREIVFVFKRVLPVAPLPDSAFAFGFSAIRYGFAIGEGARKACLDQSPSHREIRIPVWHRPDRVQVIRQNDHRLDRKAVAGAHVPNGRSDQFDMIRQECLTPVGEVDSKEIAAPAYEIAAIAGHRSLLEDAIGIAAFPPSSRVTAKPAPPPRRTGSCRGRSNWLRRRR